MKTTCKWPEVSLKTSKAGLGSADVCSVEEEVVVVVRGVSVEVGREAAIGRRKDRKTIFANIQVSE